MWILADAFTNAMILAGVVLLALIVFRRFHRRFVEHDRQPSGAKPESSHDHRPCLAFEGDATELHAIGRWRCTSWRRR